MFLNFKKKKPIHTLIQCQIQFIDADENLHKGQILKYFDPNTILCTMEEWVFDGVADEGYILDVDTKEAYPLSQIKKYWLEIVESIDVYPVQIGHGFWKMWYDKEETEKRRVKESNESNL